MRQIELYEILMHADCRVEKATPVKLYYISYGRNAWNSTWVQRYAQGCMHLSFASAAAYAEGRRTQGTVFYIRELPALCFTGEGPTFFITEINTKHPLAGFLADKVSLQGRLEDIANFFSSKRPNSILRLISDNSTSHEVLLSRSSLLPKYQSCPNGNSAPLGWRQKASEINFEAVFVLAKAFNGNIKNIELPVKIGQRKKDVSRIMDLDDKYNEVIFMMNWLNKKYKLPNDYRINLEMSPEPNVKCGNSKRKRYFGTCDAKENEAHVVLAGGRGLVGILKTAAHEFKHILQVLEGCRLKRRGKARERQANEFADKEFPIYLEERLPEAPSKVQAELGTMLYLFRLEKELELIRLSVA